MEFNRMKRRASALFKQVVTLLMAMGKAKSVAAKGKIGMTRARVAILTLFRSKKVLVSAIPTKIHALMKTNGDLCKAIVPYKGVMRDKVLPPPPPPPLLLTYHKGEDDDGEGEIVTDDEDDEYDVNDDPYPDLRHSLFDKEDDGLGGYTGSIIDLVKSARGEEEGEFVLEEEIDYVADIFLRRFHSQLRLQKLHSFKNFKERMERSV